VEKRRSRAGDPNLSAGSAQNPGRSWAPAATTNRLCQRVVGCRIYSYSIIMKDFDDDFETYKKCKQPAN